MSSFNQGLNVGTSALQSGLSAGLATGNPLIGLGVGALSGITGAIGAAKEKKEQKRLEDYNNSMNAINARKNQQSQMYGTEDPAQFLVGLAKKGMRSAKKGVPVLVEGGEIGLDKTMKKLKFDFTGSRKKHPQIKGGGYLMNMEEGDTIISAKDGAKALKAYKENNIEALRSIRMRQGEGTYAKKGSKWVSKYAKGGDVNPDPPSGYTRDIGIDPTLPNKYGRVPISGKAPFVTESLAASTYDRYKDEGYTADNTLYYKELGYGTPAAPNYYSQNVPMSLTPMYPNITNRQFGFGDNYTGGVSPTQVPKHSVSEDGTPLYYETAPEEIAETKRKQQASSDDNDRMIQEKQNQKASGQGNKYQAMRRAENDMIKDDIFGTYGPDQYPTMQPKVDNGFRFYENPGMTDVNKTTSNKTASNNNTGGAGKRRAATNNTPAKQEFIPPNVSIQSKNPIVNNIPIGLEDSLVKPTNNIRNGNYVGSYVGSDNYGKTTSAYDQLFGDQQPLKPSMASQALGALGTIAPMAINTINRLNAQTQIEQPLMEQPRLQRFRRTGDNQADRFATIANSNIGRMSGGNAGAAMANQAVNSVRARQQAQAFANQQAGMAANIEAQNINAINQANARNLQRQQIANQNNIANEAARQQGVEGAYNNLSMLAQQSVLNRNQRLAEQNAFNQANTNNRLMWESLLAINPDYVERLKQNYR